MSRPFTRAYRRLERARPLVRPTYSEAEIALLPPYGDPEVHVPGEVGTYLALGLAANAVLERLEGD